MLGLLPLEPRRVAFEMERTKECGAELLGQTVVGASLQLVAGSFMNFSASLRSLPKATSWTKQVAKFDEAGAVAVIARC